MNRRDFFAVTKRSASLKKEVKQGSRYLATGLTPYTGSWTISEVTHLLRRTMFGAKKSDIDFFLTLSPDDAVNQLLTVSPMPAPPVRDYGLVKVEDQYFDDLGVSMGQTWVNDLNTSSELTAREGIGSYRIESLAKWWVGLMVNQQRSIEEKLLLFWYHHFSIQLSEVSNHTFIYRYHDLLRRNLMGNVRQLTKDVTISPAMLRHLNGHLNEKKAPDENYARELQELMTVGKGNDSLYTEEDVREAARVLTGWRIDDVTLTSYLDVAAHDMGSKKFSSFYKNTAISGSSNGTQEVDLLIDMIFSNTEAARFICRKLYKFFVYYDIDQGTEENVIIPLAEIFKNNNYNIRPVLEALFKSEHFFDIRNRACSIKSPYDLIVGMMREFNASFPPYTDYINGYPIFRSIYYNAVAMQQDLFQPPDVSGWPAYHQDPMHYELWVNSNSLPRRAKYADLLVDQAIVDVRSFAAGTSNPADPDKLVEDSVSLLLGYPLSAASRLYVKNRFLINNTGDNNLWTTAWNSNNSAVINTALKEMYKFIMNLPEFQLC